MRKPTTGEEGAVAVIVALLLPVLIAIAGLAIDTGRAYSARTSMQSTLDAAVIASAAQELTDTASLRATINSYVVANLSGQGLTIKTTDVTYDEATEQVKVTITAEMATYFMAIAGKDKMNLSVMSEARRPNAQPLEVALVLDTTTSMNAVVGSQSKLRSLQTAATNLVNAIMVNENVRVGIVPFGTAVNIGTEGFRDPISKAVLVPWLWLDPTLEYTQFSCYLREPYQCRMVASTCDGFPCQRQICKDMAGGLSWEQAPPAVRLCDGQNPGFTSREIAWAGCIGSRAEALRDHNNNLANANRVGDYPAVVPGEIVPCAPRMQPLTTNKTTVLNVINSLFTNGDTFIPQGLLWGWNLLTPEVPFTEGRSNAEMQNLRGRKALILMTDGANSLSPLRRNPTRVVDSNHVNSTSTSSDYRSDPGYTDRLTTTLCNNIKGDRVEVYTVMFNVVDANLRTMLRNCATDSATMAFDATNAADLIDAFEEIAQQLNALRLVN